MQVHAAARNKRELNVLHYLRVERPKLESNSSLYSSLS
jgi:hypothetical protein